MPYRCEGRVLRRCVADGGGCHVAGVEEGGVEKEERVWERNQEVVYWFGS